MRLRTGTGRACRVAAKQPGLPFARLQAALGLRPRRALCSAEATTEIISPSSNGKGTSRLFHFCSHGPVHFCSHHDTHNTVRFFFVSLLACLTLGPGRPMASSLRGTGVIIPQNGHRLPLPNDVRLGFRPFNFGQFNDFSCYFLDFAQPRCPCYWRWG